jgi:putative endonuclease
MNFDTDRRKLFFATEYFKDRNIKIIETGYRVKSGTIDFIVKEDNHLAFIEVIARKATTSTTGIPEEIINAKKRKQFEECIVEYFTNTPTAPSCAIRFDIISVLLFGGSNTNKAILRHHRDAFDLNITPEEIEIKKDCNNKETKGDKIKEIFRGMDAKKVFHFAAQYYSQLHYENEKWCFCFYTSFDKLCWDHEWTPSQIVQQAKNKDIDSSDVFILDENNCLVCKTWRELADEAINNIDKWLHKVPRDLLPEKIQKIIYEKEGDENDNS